MLSAVTGAASSSAINIQPQALIQAAPVVLTSGSTEQKVRAYFADIPMLAEVARCESEFRQFNKDGSVLRGMAVASDLGVMQINEHYHGDTAKKLGYDIYTLEGNMAYAKYLYTKNGLSDWDASKPCWNKPAPKQVAVK